MSAVELVQSTRARVVLESTPVDPRTAQPGLDVCRTALRRRTAVVLANKGPLALAYGELAGLSDLTDPRAPALRFSACVGGALPTVDLGRTRSGGARVLKVEAVLNGTNAVHHCGKWKRDGRSERSLAEAQRRGLAETDPSLDVDGWDAAAKLVIVANAVLKQPATIRDVEVEGIGNVTPELPRRGIGKGQRVVLFCLAEPAGNPRRSFSIAGWADGASSRACRWPGWTLRRWVWFTTLTSRAVPRL
jgi:homoserine dehydrogenase